MTVEPRTTPQTTTARRDWTQVGREFYDPTAPGWSAEYRLETGRYPNRALLGRIFDRLDWIPVNNSTLLSFASSMAIVGFIREFGIPRVSHVAESADLAPFGLIAVRGHYNDNGTTVNAYAVETGTTAIPLAMDVIEAK